VAGTAGIVLDLFARSERFRYGPHRQHRADLHVPREGGSHPVVVLIHGGYWRATYGKVVMKPLAADLVRRGFATWSIEYRRIGRRQGGGYPQTFDDVRAAFGRLGELEDPRLDMDDVTVLGHSAGGQLALWAASRDDLGGVRIRRVVALAPVVDLVACGAPAHELMGGPPERLADRYAECDPMQLLPPPVPVVIVHGPNDATVPIKRSRTYLEAARAAGADVELVEPPSAGHRSLIDPRSEGWRAAVETLEELSRRSSAPPAAR